MKSNIFSKAALFLVLSVFTGKSFSEYVFEIDTHRPLRDVPIHTMDTTPASVDLTIDKTFTWKYGSLHGRIILAHETAPDKPKACIIFSAAAKSENLIVSSDPHKSCKFTNEPSIGKKNNTRWIKIPIEIDSSGEDKNYIPSVINLLLDTRKKTLCSTDVNQTSRWACRKSISAQFYRDTE